MIMHEITLDGYAAQCDEHPIRLGTEGSYGVEKLRVMRKGEWVNYDIIIAFHPPKGDAVQISLGSDNSVSVPAEATASAGTGEITFAGCTDGVRQISVSQIYRVAATAGVSGTTPAEPTPDIVQQILSAASNAEEIAQSVRDDADAGKFNGPQGPKGDTGPIGPQGPQGPKGDTGPAVALDTTLTHEGEAADAKATGDAIRVVKERLDEIPKIDDTAITTTSPWSSKQIIDTLCPPLEETGNPVVCYPVAGYPLDVTVSWGPTQEGSGTPSPENIRPIKGRDSVTVERCGENLVKFPYYTPAASRNGLVMTSQQDGSITINGTATADTWLVININLEKRLPLNTPMTLSGCPAGGSTKSYYIGLYLGGKWFSDSGNGSTDIKFTTREVNSRIEATIIKGTVCNNLTFYPKIEVGTTITPYSKYQGSANTLTLPKIVYGGEVDAVMGDGKRTWEIIDNYAGETIPREWISDRDVYSADKNPTVGAQVAYRLAEPVPFTATGGGEITALPGVNTLITNADSVSVSGRADPIHIIEELQAK